MARPKDSGNKDKIQASLIAKRMGVDPFEVLIHFITGNATAIGYTSEYEVRYTAKGEPYQAERISADMRLRAAIEATKYLYAQIKAVEHSAPDGIMITAPAIVLPPNKS